MQFRGEVKTLNPACTALKRSGLAAVLSKNQELIKFERFNQLPKRPFCSENGQGVKRKVAHNDILCFIVIALNFVFVSLQHHLVPFVLN